MLADAEDDGKQRHDPTSHGSDGDRGGDTEPEVAGEIGGRESDHGAKEHDAFDAKVEDAGALVDEFAHGCQNKRRRNPDDRGEEADLKDLDDEIKHGALPAGGKSQIGAWRP